MRLSMRELRISWCCWVQVIAWCEGSCPDFLVDLLVLFFSCFLTSPASGLASRLLDADSRSYKGLALLEKFLKYCR